jgi:hypothetical protein
MIEFAKITGLTDKPNLIQVQLNNGEKLYAPMVTLGINVSIPSAMWIAKNKDNFLALVSFAGDIDQDPFVLGFYPLRGASSEDYNLTERMIDKFKELLNKLGQARVLTQLGPQQFMPDTIIELQKMSAEVDLLEQEINKLK